MVITIKTGSGQGYPLSSLLFLLATEPLSLSIAQNNSNLMYITEGGTNAGPILFDDDYLNPFRFSSADEICSLLQLNSKYQQISGLNVNIRKIQALCISTPNEVVAGP
jgi:hypothetical protein